LISAHKLVKKPSGMTIVRFSSASRAAPAGLARPLPRILGAAFLA
jgi:hypothetical protein